MNTMLHGIISLVVFALAWMSGGSAEKTDDVWKARYVGDQGPVL